MKTLGLVCLTAMLLAGCSTNPITPGPRTAIVSLENFYFAPVGAEPSVASFATLLPNNDRAFKSLMQCAAQAPSLELALARADAARAVSNRAIAERKPALDVGVSAGGTRSNPNQFGSLPAGVAPDSTRFEPSIG